MNRQELLDQASRLVLPHRGAPDLAELSRDYPRAYLWWNETKLIVYALAIKYPDAECRFQFLACPRDNPRAAVILDGIPLQGDDICLRCASMLTCVVSGQTHSFKLAGSP